MRVLKALGVKGPMGIVGLDDVEWIFGLKKERK